MYKTILLNLAQKLKIKLIFKIVFFAGLPVILMVAFANIFTLAVTKDDIYEDVSKIPKNKVGLILGSKKGTYYFNRRIKAAVELYEAGKVENFIVSGDNHIRTYDEPTDMKEALIARGVPANAITCDYAGFRTLDSVVRAKKIFDQDKITIISQKFHNYRALLVARKYGIDAVGFNAANAPGRRSNIYINCRELLARTLAIFDLYVINKQPKFLGKKELLACQQEE